MITFAEELARTVKGHEKFWLDVEEASAAALRHLLPGAAFNPLQKRHDEHLLWRLLRSASVLSQTANERDKGLAQDLALFIAVTSEDAKTKAYACDLFSELGNHPGAHRLEQQLGIEDDFLLSSIRRAVLRAFNTVLVAETPYAFTDFQYGLWSRLPKMKAGAVSAPTSAGKSFVVIEHLCQRTVSEDKFAAVFVAPTRALLGEVHAKISSRLREHDETIRVSTIPTLDSEDKDKQIFVLTQERLQVLLAIWDGKFDLVIVDEAQGIGDDSRGMILQECLELIGKRSPKAQFLFLAPGASGFEALATAVNLANIDVAETELSPVVQNRIVVNQTVGDESSLDVAMMADVRRVNIGTLSAKRGFGNGSTLLAAVALELGKDGGSLVYGTGPADAEKVASQIASDIEPIENPRLKELSKFVIQHVHAKYSLASHVLRGVGFHYGKMPSLLREALEQAFQVGDLKYLVCTTTLFQGVNLPARNVFIDTPNRGRNGKLDAASLWNFAGRAGRLGKEIVGNVFLVDYDKWESTPFTAKAKFAIAPSFKRVVSENASQITAWLNREVVAESTESIATLETAGGLMMSHAARGSLRQFVKRTIGESIDAGKSEDLVSAAEAAFHALDLPIEALSINWTVNPFGQARLLKRFREKIKDGKADDLIPVHPVPWSRSIYSRYLGIFSRLNREIFGKSASPKFNNRLASDALAWMGGKPLPVMIGKRISYAQTQRSNVKIDTQVRGVFDFIEDTLRFKYVQLGRCYIDLLKFALEEAELHDAAKSVYDFPLALELGVSSIAGQAFVELGLSRITSATLEALIPDSKPTVDRAREWIAGLSEVGSKLSHVIWEELLRKGLVRAEAPI